MRLVFACVFFLAQILPAHVNAKTTETITPPNGRLALIVGISDYDSIPDLKNPGRDAKAIADTLSALGFDVETASDVDLAGFNAAIDRVARRAKGKEAVLFYYAGHGFQLGGRNYLVPKDASLTDRTRIPDETIALDDVIARLENRNRQTLVLLDACRNNPIPKAAQGSGSADGLAQIETGSGTFVAFATQPGNITNDGAGQNSPFTRALVDNMVVEGISISDMMIRVRNQVEEATLQKQTPWDQSSLRSQFYFNPTTEETDSLTEEDLALLEELDPVLREKFKKRFGLVNLDASQDDEAGEAVEIVATVKPTLMIESAADTAPDPAQDIAITRDTETGNAANESDQPPASGEIEIAALDPQAPKPRKPGLMIVAAEPEENEAEIEPALPTLDGEAIVRVEIPLPVSRPATEQEKAVELAALNPAAEPESAVKPPVSPQILAPSITGSFVAPQLLPGATGPQIFIPAKPEPKTETQVAALEPSASATGKAARLVRPDASAQASNKPSTQPSEENQAVQSRTPAETEKPSTEQITIEPADTAIPAPQKLAPPLTPAPAAEEKQVAALQPAENLKAPEPEELPEEAALPPAPPAVVEEETLSETELAEKAQRELSRLGCYRSTIDGDWGPKSARALLRFYAAQKLDPDEIEPTTALIKRLEEVETVVCKTTEPSRPAVSTKPAKTVTSRPAKPSKPTPAVKRSTKPSAPVAKKSAPAPKATASSKSTKKKLTGKSIIGAFR